MSFNLQKNQLYFYSLYIMIAICLESECKVDDYAAMKTRFIGSIPGLDQITQSYCNAACGPSRYAFASALKMICKFKCPNSTLANIPLGGETPTAAGTTESSMIHYSNEVINATITIPNATDKPGGNNGAPPINPSSTVNPIDQANGNNLDGSTSSRPAIGGGSAGGNENGASAAPSTTTTEATTTTGVTVSAEN